MSAAGQPLQPFSGARVVRGPDWKWGSQDGGDGHVGTVRKYKSSDEVVVVWDHGTAANYRYGDAHDLRILDSAPAGIKHESFTCDGCGMSPIYGTRWECSVCDNFDLCSMCYHGDKHDLQHQFNCSDFPGASRQRVGPRGSSRKISAYGLFAGASVTRGADWEYGNQDGILFWKSGKITHIQNWEESKPNSAARVEWDFGQNNIYRVGFDGKVDIKATSKAMGFSFYRDHLPVLQIANLITVLKIGDRVRIGLDLETVKSLQTGHGEWNDDMVETLSGSGTVDGFNRNNDALVSYPSGNRWLLNPAVLTCADQTSFKVGDIVRISSDLARVKALQDGHGDWVDNMIPTLGKIGKVKRVFADQDLQVEVAGKIWVYNPACVSKANATVDDVTESLSDLLKNLLGPGILTNPTQELVQAAANNNVQKIRALLSSGNVQIDDAFNGVNAVLVASFKGSLEALKVLIQHGADLESKDKDGDRAIQNAAYCDEIKAIELLVNAGAEIDSRNDKNQSALHVAVNKGNNRAVRCLLTLKANPSLQDFAGDTPLHDAITKDKDEIVQLLLEFKADISVKNSKGFNCLHHAAIQGHVGAITALLATEPHPRIINDKKDDGFTALHLASLNKHQRVAEMLIKQGKADVDAQNNKHQTSLHLAIGGQSIQMVQLLVEEGASLDMKDKDGDTPMHEAFRHHTLLQLKQMQESTNVAMALLGFGSPESSSQNSSSIACFLASHGADLTLRNNKNQTPLDLCLDPNLSQAVSEWHVPRQSARVSVASQSAGSLRASGGAMTMGNTGSPTTEVATGSAEAATGSENTSRTTAITRESSEEAAADQKLESDCIICCDNPRDTLLIPCNHIAVCSLCSPRMKKCLICKGHIESKVQIEECFVCSDNKSNVLFKPCNHICVCSGCAKLMKKCAQCRKPIEEAVGYADLCGANYSRNIENSNMTANNSNVTSEEVNQLTQELNAVKEQIICPICMDRRRNVVFLCGHGTCKDCGDRLMECPMCRKPIEKRVSLF